MGHPGDYTSVKKTVDFFFLKERYTLLSPLVLIDKVIPNFFIDFPAFIKCIQAMLNYFIFRVRKSIKFSLYE